MRPTIVAPADVGGPALAELKDWLGISRPNDDAMLASLLSTSLAMCEAYTGQTALQQTVEERLPTIAGRYYLLSRPIDNVLTVELIDQNGSRSPLLEDTYEIEMEAPGNACFKLNSDAEGQAIAINARVGIAATWQSVPSALRQGLIRLAAYHYQDRVRPSTVKRELSPPPASVTALWRPWREVRLR